MEVKDTDITTLNLNMRKKRSLLHRYGCYVVVGLLTLLVADEYHHAADHKVVRQPSRAPGPMVQQEHKFLEMVHLQADHDSVRRENKWDEEDVMDDEGNVTWSLMDEVDFKTPCEGDGLAVRASTSVSRVRRFSTVYPFDIRRNYTICVEFENDVISSHLLEHGYWRDCRYIPELVVSAASLGGSVTVTKRPLLVDVGANLGSCALEGAALGFRVIAIEPLKRSYSLLNNSISYNNFTSLVKLYPVAVGRPQDSGSEASCFVEVGNFGNAIMAANESMLPSTSQYVKETVSVVTLDELISEHVNVLKIDTQGYEARVLEGATRLLHDYGVDVIRAEYDPRQIRMVGDEPVKFLMILEQQGYNIYVIDESGQQRGRSYLHSEWLRPSLFRKFSNFLEDRGEATHLNATKKLHHQRKWDN